MHQYLFGSRRGAIGLALALSAPLPIPQAFAQGLEEIIVTARQREENLFEAPLSVTSLSGEELERANIRDIKELQAYTPGFYYTAQASTSSLRIAPSVRFRGMNNNFADPLQQQGGVFIDGIFLFAGVQSLTMDDIERVEVIKGPQSALFGRSTFGGAINFITKRPADHFKAKATVGVETRGTYDTIGSVEGPIMGDKLLFRLSGGRNVKGGHWTTTDGGKLGHETTNVINSQLVFNPTDALELRVRRMDNWQDDERGMTVNMNASLPGLANAPNRCQPSTQPYWCGEIGLPGSKGVPFSALSMVTKLNTAAFNASNYPNAISAVLNADRAFPLVRNGMPYQSSVPKLNHSGLAGRYQRTSLGLVYDLPNGMKYDATYVYSKMASFSATSTSDDFGNSMGISPNILTDYSFDTRLSSDGAQRFTWSIGANYFLQTELGGLAGTGINVQTLDATRLVTYIEPTTFSGQARNQYYGVFGALHYDITDQLAADFEGRWQSDRVTSSYELSVQTSATFKAFVPRAILTYKPAPGMTIYTSWARGVMPGTTNANVPLWTPAIQAQVLAVPGFVTNVPEESVDNFELGVKRQSSVFRYAVTGYYMNWKNLKNQVNFVCPGNLCGPGLPGANAIVFIPQPSHIYGIEAEVGLAINDHWDVNVSADYVHARYLRYVDPAGLAPTGRIDASGNTIIGFPTSQAVLASTYRGSLTADWGWYVRGNVSYAGRMYVDPLNSAWIGSSVKVGSHIGVERNGMRFEVYGDNLTNDKHWQGGLRGTQNNFHLGAAAVAQSSAILVLPRLRTFGVRATVEFDQPLSVKS